MPANDQGLQVISLNTDRSRSIVALTIVFLLLATIFVALRVWSVRLRKTTYRLDDYLIFSALFLYYGQATCTIIQVFLGGSGHHTQELGPRNIELTLQMLIPLAILYSIELTFIKCSICLLMVHIFFIKSFRISAYIVMSITIGWGIFSSIATWVICTPIAFNWNPNITGGHCGNRNAVYYAVGIIDVITDILIFLLPTRMVWRLQISLANKIGLSLVFGIGLISIIISGLRAHSTLSISFTDFTYTSATGFIWSQIEPGIGLIVSSSLVLRPVLDRAFPKGFARSVLRHSHTKEDTITSNEHNFPLRDTRHGNTTTTAFGATPARTSSDAIVDGGVAEGATWKYRKMDDDEAAGRAGEGWRGQA